jgi:hypothetical protein
MAGPGLLTSAATRGSVASDTYPIGTSSEALGGASAPPNATSYSGTFIPEIWSGKLLAKFYDATVLGAIANTDYEGEIRNQGDTIHIRTRPTIDISDYTPDADLVVQRPNADVVDLNIEYAKYFNCIIDDVWEVQSDIDQMDLWAEDASEQMKIVIDTQMLLLEILGAANATNIGATAGRISQDINLGVTLTPLTVVASGATGIQINVIDLIINCGQVLDEQNIPEGDRWFILPAWMAAMIKKSELRDASLTGDGTSMLRNGRLGMIDRFTLYMSNLLPAGVPASLAAGETAVFAGHVVATTFASQLTRMETMRSERTFGQLMRGLQVYGCEVIKDEALVEMIVDKV